MIRCIPPRKQHFAIESSAQGIATPGTVASKAIAYKLGTPQTNAAMVAGRMRATAGLHPCFLWGMCLTMVEELYTSPKN